MTYSQELTLIQTAISDILQYGQSMSVLGRSLNRANLTDLYAREAYLKSMVARETTSYSSVSHGVI